MEPLLFGLETEYAIGAVGTRGTVADRAAFVMALIMVAQETYPHLADETLRGLFLPSGARFYVDAGNHPEMSTPECDNPWDVVRYTMAGHRIVTTLAAEIDRRRGHARTTVFRTNVDYLTGHSFGSHESYGHRAPPALLAEQIVPHLASRVIYTGGGGFDARSPGIDFLLSPRAAHIVRRQSSESTHDRGIIHTKDEPLRGGGFHRLHLICGETSCSELSAWLRVGTTALIVALVDAGQRPAGAINLDDPLRALHAFAADPRGTATAATAGGSPLTAVAIQRQYLAAVEAHLPEHILPPWAGDVCARWRAVLDDLEQGTAQAATALDWAIKLPLYRERARLRGFDWDALPAWSDIIARMRLAWVRSSRGTEPFQVEAALERDSPIADEVAKLTRQVHAARRGWEELPRLLALRDELCEIDLRFGQLGDDGIFNRLDAAGLLTHHVDGIDRIDVAMTEPPNVRSAQRRAQLVRELAPHGHRYHCDWVCVRDHHEERYLDLSDPGAEPTWSTTPPDAFDTARATLARRLRAATARARGAV